MYWDAKALARSLGVRLVEPGWQIVEKEIQGIQRDSWPTEPGTMATKPCLVPWLHSYVTALGDMVPCCNALARHVMGNIHDQTFEEIWHGERYQAFRAQMLSSNPPDGCRDCRLPEPPWSLQTPVSQALDMGHDNIQGVSWQGLEGRVLGWHEREWQPVPRWRALVPVWKSRQEIGPRRGFRWTGSSSVLFLRNVAPGLLHLDVGTLSLIPAVGHVMVNGKKVGRFRVPPGRTRLRYRLGEYSGDVLAIEIVVERTHCVAELNPLWKLVNAAWTVMSDRVLPVDDNARRTFGRAYRGLSRDSRIVGIKVYDASIELCAVV